MTNYAQRCNYTAGKYSIKNLYEEYFAPRQAAKETRSIENRYEAQSLDLMDQREEFSTIR